MFSASRWIISGIWLLIAINVGADESEEQLSAEFLRYLAEFSDDEGTVIDPEIMAEVMNNQLSDAQQTRAQSSTEADVLDDEVKP